MAHHILTIIGASILIILVGADMVTEAAFTVAVVSTEVAAIMLAVAEIITRTMEQDQVAEVKMV